MPTISPNPGGFQFEVEKDTKTPPGTPASILPLVVIGYCTNTTDAPVAEPVPITEPSAAQTLGGEGPAVELSAAALDPNGRVSLVHLVNTGASNAATYGTLAQSWANAAPPVAEADSVVLPDDDFDVKILWTVGGTVGTAGAKYRVALDNDQHYFAEQPLGTATSITLPNGGGKINLLPSPATLVTLANELKVDYEAHRVLTAGSVHGAADATNAVSAANATDLATAITLLNDLRTQYEAHRVLTAGSVHGAADATNAVSAPAATDLATAITLANELKVDYEAHRVLTAGSVHGAADATNAVSAANATAAPGVITAGDFITVSTNAPTPDATEILTALQSLRTYTGDFGTIVLAAPIPASYISTIKDELIELWKRNKFPKIVAFFRRPAIGESTTSYRTALEDLDGIVCVDIDMCSGAVYHQSALINTADGKATPRRPQWWYAMAAARNEPEVDIQFVPPQNGVRIRDSRGRLLPGCLDEASGELYSVEHRTIGTKTDTVRDPNGGVFVTQDIVLYDSNSDWILAAYSRVVNAALRVSAPVVLFASTPPNGFPSAPAEPLDKESQDSIKADVEAVLKPEMIDKRRCTQVAFSFVDSVAGVIKWKITTVPNTYFINGVLVKASVSLERVV